LRETRPRGSLADRIERALLVLVGAAVLGPLLPALAFTLMTGVAWLLPEGASRPALPFLPAVGNIFASAYLDGGGLTAGLAGFLVGCIVLLRGAVPGSVVSLISCATAFVVGWWRVAQVHGRASFILVVAFALVAVLSARLLQWLDGRFGLLGQNATGRTPDFTPAPGHDRLPPR
jgi:hypothetical protein